MLRIAICDDMPEFLEQTRALSACWPRRPDDMSIATFSFYFDIYGKCYWKQMLDAIGITEAQLPELIEPCSVAGALTAGAAKAAGLTTETLVNVGTLDHFAGMIGTGNTAQRK